MSNEVIGPALVERITSTLLPEIGEPLRQHPIESHTTIEQVGRDVAQFGGSDELRLDPSRPRN